MKCIEIKYIIYNESCFERWRTENYTEHTYKGIPPGIKVIEESKMYIILDGT